MIRRNAPGGAKPFAIVPYNLEYQGELAEAARLLREAAKQTTQPTLKKFLDTRADAFLTNDYYASDVAWMELDASIEPTIGPYEVYEDEWFNYKAAYESFITIRDEAESAKLASFGAELQEIEDHLPIEPSLRNPKLGSLAPIRVVNVVFTAGDGNRGVQTAAYNLPNDERVVREKGSKRVMLKNMQEAKFSVVLKPIARVALSEADQSRVAFDAFFTHILMHELMHGLGPHQITVAGKQTTVRQSLKDTYSTIEEAKADISGLWALQHLIDRGKLPASMSDTLYTTFVASRDPIDPVRPQRGTWPRHRHPVELPAGSGRRDRCRRWDAERGTREDPRRRRGADAPDHDAAGARRLRRREGARRHRRRPARDPETARQAR